jgi:hypothetical protein
MKAFILLDQYVNLPSLEQAFILCLLTRSAKREKCVYMSYSLILSKKECTYDER